MRAGEKEDDDEERRRREKKQQPRRVFFFLLLAAAVAAYLLLRALMMMTVNQCHPSSYLVQFLDLLLQVAVFDRQLRVLVNHFAQLVLLKEKEIFILAHDRLYEVHPSQTSGI